MWHNWSGSAHVYSTLRLETMLLSFSSRLLRYSLELCYLDSLLLQFVSRLVDQQKIERLFVNNSIGIHLWRKLLPCQTTDDGSLTMLLTQRSEPFISCRWNPIPGLAHRAYASARYAVTNVESLTQAFDRESEAVSGAGLISSPPRHAYHSKLSMRYSRLQR